MAVLANRAWMSTATAGTGTITLGSALSGYQTFADAGITNGQTVPYTIIDGAGFEIGTGTYTSAGTTLTRTVTESTNSDLAINLSGSATVFITARAEDILSFFEDQTFTAAEKAQGRANLGAADYQALAFNNVVVNPKIDVSQELGTTGATLSNGSATHIADNWQAAYNHGAATAVLTSAQLAAASFGAALPGFSFGHQIKATTAITAPANGDYAVHRQHIEGYRIATWGFGAAGALDIVVAFQLYSTVSGVALVRLSNSSAGRLYYHEITVAAGWNFYAFTVAGDTSGTWLTTTGIGLRFDVFVCGKETTPGTSFDTWGATVKIQTTNSTNLLGTNNNLTVLTGVYIAPGTQLPVAADLPKLMRPHSTELTLCQRWLEYGSYNIGAQAAPTGGSTGKVTRWPIPFKVTKATAPTITITESSKTRCATALSTGVTTDNFTIYTTNSNADGDDYNTLGTWNADARI